MLKFGQIIWSDIMKFEGTSSMALKPRKCVVSKLNSNVWSQKDVLSNQKIYNLLKPSSMEKQTKNKRLTAILLLVLYFIFKYASRDGYSSHKKGSLFILARRISQLSQHSVLCKAAISSNQFAGNFFKTFFLFVLHNRRESHAGDEI